MSMDGVALRDYFAAQLAAGLARDRRDHQEIAREAYAIADALVEERQRSPSRHEKEVTDRSPQYALVEPELEHWLIASESSQGLLDRPYPLREEADDVPPSWRDREFNPEWDSRVRWSPGEAGPGLRSTRPGPITKKKERVG